jgi:alkylation response protein AidB-like acyl-CoA dehydrogenase
MALAEAVCESEERAALRASVAAIGHDFGHAYWVRHARSGMHPEELWDALVRAGFAGVNIAAEHGGSGGDLYDLMIVAEELAAAGCPLMTLVVSPAICGPILERFGTTDQQREWLTGIATGKERMAFAITEPDAGSNTHALSTSAKRGSGGWHLRGEKYYISGVDDARSVLAVARTGTDEVTRRGRLSLFVVETDRPGLSISPIATQVLATERQFTLTFDDVVVPEGNLIGEEGAGLRLLFAGLNPERILSAAICAGMGRYALEKAGSYARTRSVWGEPIGTHQAVAHPLARAYVAVELARLMNQKACLLHDAGRECGAEANMAKLSAADAAAAALDAAIQTHGGNGLSEEFGIADLWGLTRLYGIAPVSREMILNFVAQLRHRARSVHEELEVVRARSGPRVNAASCTPLSPSCGRRLGSAPGSARARAAEARRHRSAGILGALFRGSGGAGVPWGYQTSAQLVCEDARLLDRQHDVGTS